MKARPRLKGERSVTATSDSGRNVASFSRMRANPFKIRRVFRPAAGTLQRLEISNTSQTFRPAHTATLMFGCCDGDGWLYV